mmetsp:Transcript_28999/g.27959  ORF Transcript_28999/g.27959 Transcript_28999/m.27959 type:complete len:111 (+) Transcript_28999:73-405(+)
MDGEESPQSDFEKHIEEALQSKGIDSHFGILLGDEITRLYYKYKKLDLYNLDNQTELLQFYIQNLMEARESKKCLVELIAITRIKIILNEFCSMLMEVHVHNTKQLNNNL